MDRNELNLKMEELKTAMHNRDFEKAVDIADTLELKKIKDNNFLSLVADAYEVTHKYKEAKKVLLLAYENTNAGRHLAYRLCLIAIKTKEFNEAQEYYEDFVEMAPRDTGRYILKYKMAKAKGASVDKLIRILEEYVNIDMEEKWAYELAKLYHMAGEEEKCVDMCDEISLWFSDGKYVVKAMDLKKMYHPLTSTQQQKYDENKKKNLEKTARDEMKKSSKTRTKKAEKSEMEKDLEEGNPFEINIDEVEVQDMTEIKIKPADGETYKTIDIQSVVADGMKEVELDNEANLHEGEGATKIAPDFTKAPPLEKTPEIVEELREEIEEPMDEVEPEKEEMNKFDEKEEQAGVTEKDIETEEDSVEKINDIQDVEDILRRLQERGILKAETVQQAVHIIDESEKEKGNITEKEEISDSGNDSTIERWERDNKPQEEKKETLKDNESLEEEKKIVEDEIREPDTQAEETISETKVIETEIIENKQAQKPESDGLLALDDIVEEVEELETAENAATKDKTGKIPGVPVFDLSFDAPERDTTNDIGQKNMYKNMVVNSDLGNTTDKLPSKEEIDEAIKTAEAEMEKMSEEQSLSTESPKGETDLHSKKNLSAKVEIISGTDWKQQEIQEEAKTDKKDVEMMENESNRADAKVSEDLVDNSAEKIENKQVDLQKEQDSVDEAESSEAVQHETANKSGISESVQSEITEETESIGKSRKDKPVEADLAQINSEFVLTEEELEVFNNYLNVEGFEDNIREILKKLIVDYHPNGKSTQNNVVIMGESKAGKTTLAIELIKLVNKKRGRRNRKLAKIDAKALNRRGMRNSLNKLLGCDLIIENAQNLGVMTLSEIVDVSGMFTDDMLIVLEGETSGMERILEESPRISTVFNHVIKIKEYDIKEWVEYGVRYAESQGYSIDELANLAFYKAVDDCFGQHNGIGQKEIEAIVDTAIDKSSRLGRKITGIFSSKKDENGLYILVESDFNF